MNINKLHEIHNDIKEGYTEYGIYFWISSLSVIIGGFFGAVGVGAFIITIIFFYQLGRLHRHIEKKVKVSPPT